MVQKITVNELELAEPVWDTPRILDIPEAIPEEAPEAEQMELLPSFSDIQLDAEISRTSDDEEEDWLPQPAPFLQRFVAGLVDAALVCIATGVFVATFLKLAEDVPQSRIVAFCELAMGGVLWLLFQYVFLVYARTTPGMRIAQLELAAFEGKTTSLFARRYRALMDGPFRALLELQEADRFAANEKAARELECALADAPDPRAPNPGAALPAARLGLYVGGAATGSPRQALARALAPAKPSAPSTPSDPRAELLESAIRARGVRLL